MIFRKEDRIRFTQEAVDFGAVNSRHMGYVLSNPMRPYDSVLIHIDGGGEYYFHPSFIELVARTRKVSVYG